MTEPARPELIIRDNVMTCPHCGATGPENFLYLETVSNHREVTGIEDGTLVMQSYYQVLDEDGEDPRLGCRACDKDCDIPEDLELEWR
jgi:hypothetical protein